jgi:RecB family exonuclease
MIPQVQNFSMQFGTVVHNVLERTANMHFEQGKRPSDTELKVWIETELDRLPLSKTDYTTMHERAFACIITYLDEVLSGWMKSGRTELKLEVEMETGLSTCPTVRLTGKLDRLDFNEAGNAIRLIDYKTGSPKSRNVIEGNTKDSTGDYKRQLVFYALLLELHGDERYQTRDMTLSFVEANTSGKIKEELFTITDEEVDSFKTEIITATKAIVGGEAWREPCDPDQSEYCQLLNW